MSYYENFWQYTDQFVRLSKADKQIIASKIQVLKVSQGTVLTNVGDIPKSIYFVVSGCVRMYYLSDGKEITGFIFEENTFAGSIDSYFSKESSLQVVETLEACILLEISIQSMEYLLKHVKNWEVLSRKLCQDRLAFTQKLQAALIMNKPLDRYKSYLKIHPNIENRVPHKVLASYIGITPVSLSRIRKRLSN